MNYVIGAFSGLVVLLFFIGCERERRSFHSVGERELTTLDAGAVLLNPTSKNRFEPPQSEDESAVEKGSDPAFHYELPEGWKEEKTSMFRLVNMSLKSGGEVYVSLVGGQLLANVNRWYGQFGLPSLTQEQLEKVETVDLLGQKGYVIRALGSYNPGMGKPKQDGVLLLGALAQLENGLVTVKLIAPEESGNANEEAFKRFCASLKEVN